ncbi:MAG: hypothetical protein EXR72_04080 [Myxococcales bacterium]|nr:hypothetical protein [Myxococcales bacterium]
MRTARLLVVVAAVALALAPGACDFAQYSPPPAIATSAPPQFDASGLADGPALTDGAAASDAAPAKDDAATDAGAGDASTADGSALDGAPPGG